MFRHFGLVHLIIPLSHRVFVQLNLGEPMQAIDFKLVQVPCRSADHRHLLGVMQTCKKQKQKNKIKPHNFSSDTHFFIRHPVPRPVGRPNRRYEQMAEQTCIVDAALDEKR